MCGAVSKSGSPISRCTMLRPCASRPRALASTSKALSVPRRAWRAAICGMTLCLLPVWCWAVRLHDAGVCAGPERGTAERLVQIRRHERDDARDLARERGAVQRAADLRHE